MKRTFIVDKVEFRVDNGRLAYRTSHHARAYQVVAAIGIAIVSAALALILAKNKPLAGVIDGGDAWNTAAVLFFVSVAGSLLVAIPIYVRGSIAPFVVDGRKRMLCLSGKEIVELSGSVRIELAYDSGGGGEYSGVPTVVARDANTTRRLPLLTFEHQSEAQRVAAEVAAVLEIPLNGPSP